MEKLFVPYELALKLKEKGFDEECLGWIETDGHIFLPTFVRLVKNSNCHGSNCALPTYQQVIDWFREKHNMDIVIIPYSSFTKKYSFNVFHVTKETNTTLSYCTGYDYYDLVQIDAIKSALTLI